MRRLKLISNPKVALGVIAVHVALLSALLWLTSRKPVEPAAPKQVILQTVTLPPLKAAQPAATELQPSPKPPTPSKPPRAEPPEKPLPKRLPEKSSRLESLPAAVVVIDASPLPASTPAPPTPTVAVTAVTAVAAITVPAPARDTEAAEPIAARPDHERCPQAGYPLPLKERGIEGTVWLRVQVTMDGQPAAVSLLRGSGWRLFDEAALQAARACRFIPARRGLERLASWVEFPMRFALDS